ncbi:hypothetical protein N7504_006255 [Penicillium tannophilum]|nr:hypothetical protein N7504_006255 [Penicillium tannophilum]
MPLGDSPEGLLKPLPSKVLPGFMIYTNEILDMEVLYFTHLGEIRISLTLNRFAHSQFGLQHALLRQDNRGDFFEIVGKPEIGRVQRRDGKDHKLGVPEYIVKPTLYRTYLWNSA